MRIYLNRLIAVAIIGLLSGCPYFLEGQTATNTPVKQIAPNLFEIGSVQLDSKNKTVIIPSLVNLDEGQIEYLLVSKAGKLHESLLKTDAEPYHIQVAMLLLNARPTQQDSYFKNETEPIPGESVSIKLSWRQNGVEKIAPAEDLILNIIKKTQLKRGNWVFNGSRIIEGEFIAQRDRSIIAIKPDIDAIFNNPVSCKENENDWIVNTNIAPKINTPVNVIIELKQSKNQNVNKDRGK